MHKSLHKRSKRHFITSTCFASLLCLAPTISFAAGYVCESTLIEINQTAVDDCVFDRHISADMCQEINALTATTQPYSTQVSTSQNIGSNDRTEHTQTQKADNSDLTYDQLSASTKQMIANQQLTTSALTSCILCSDQVPCPSLPRHVKGLKQANPYQNATE